MKTKDVNNLIEELFKLDPIDLTKPTALNEEMKLGLAYAYSNQGFRKYMELAINNLIINSATKADDWDGVLYRRGGIIILKQLFSICRENFMVTNKKLTNKFDQIQGKK